MQFLIAWAGEPEDQGRSELVAGLNLQPRTAGSWASSPFHSAYGSPDSYPCLIPRQKLLNRFNFFLIRSNKNVFN